MSLTADEVTRLATLKSVRDKLIMGQAVDRVSYNGFETSFKASDLARVESEIEKLERKRDGKHTRQRGALRFRL